VARQHSPVGSGERVNLARLDGMRIRFSLRSPPRRYVGGQVLLRQLSRDIRPRLDVAHPPPPAPDALRLGVLSRWADEPIGAPGS
jgi:hypothetical protein